MSNVKKYESFILFLFYIRNKNKRNKNKGKSEQPGFLMIEFVVALSMMMLSVMAFNYMLYTIIHVQQLACDTAHLIDESKSPQVSQPFVCLSEPVHVVFRDIKKNTQTRQQKNASSLCKSSFEIECELIKPSNDAALYHCWRLKRL